MIYVNVITMGSAITPDNIWLTIGMIICRCSLAARRIVGVFQLGYEVIVVQSRIIIAVDVVSVSQSRIHSDIARINRD
ncbi:MAG: hypothetical protein A2675_03840 [Candidatus Yonathbacteria bacterium RIFCSPHIGHO2_01_FULL_51_10]|uniref:Uncharacterized protein n=1 Tax=Candidatus Yonathbacteria bacterium RIFCSPHIGHO2_01_FULL_51_10 TaxID=1802723 RepID=A0A1G2S9D9_9BACT|nr:MAG: hypothetical protein A2675_03840 [Candidatus Yonathbacteria bacterium RIFCSPHIGHO2_01_FULL_51_10]